MIYRYLLTIALIFIVLVTWVGVQRLYLAYRRRHPELGPYREEGGCGAGCGTCGTASCPTDTQRVP